jgi:ferric-dicitrate binding protein FerR (iron transport regulator)
MMPRRKNHVLDHLPVLKAPEEIWTSLEAALDGSHPRVKAPARPFRIWQFGLAAAVIVFAIGGAFYWRSLAGEGWVVTRLAGAPTVGARIVGSGKTGRIGPGQWLQTDGSSRAEIRVGDIGTVQVEPGSRIRLIAARPGEHRLALAHGEITARVTAPPRLFVVDTAAGTAIDMGCAYKLRADESGSGLLEVTAGWVLLEGKGRESLVPAGASCLSRPGAGPGTPYFNDAPKALREALESFDREGVGMDIVLAQSRVRDTLTLWHLLSRVDAGSRVRVYDRMAALIPPPGSVSREKILLLDPGALKLWKDELAWTW